MTRKTRIILTGVGVIAAFGIGAASGAASTASTPPRTITVTVPGPTVTKPVPGPTVTEPAPPAKTVTVPPPAPTAPAAAPVAATFSDGTHVVGTDIPAGTYKTTGPVSSDIMDSCYWARLSNLSGDLGGINANDNITGPTTIEISPSDKAVEFNGGCTWTRLAA